MYKPFYQGMIDQNQLNINESPFCSLRSALINTVPIPGLLILDGYTLALIKPLHCFYIFDSHQRNCYGMPDPDGVAVVMKCLDIDDCHEYICSLSKEF